MFDKTGSLHALCRFQQQRINTVWQCRQVVLFPCMLFKLIEPATLRIQNGQRFERQVSVDRYDARAGVRENRNRFCRGSVAVTSDSVRVMVVIESGGRVSVVAFPVK